MAEAVDIGGNGTLFIGEDKTLRLELIDSAGVPVDHATWVELFDIRAKDTSPAPAIVSLTPTIIGVYSATRSVNSQRAIVVLTDDHMNLFRQKVYRYSWKRMDDDSETVLAWGDFAPEKATAP